MKQLVFALAMLAGAGAPAVAGGFHHWGKLAKYKKTDFFTFSYKAPEGGKLRSQKAWVKVGDGVRFFRDQRLPLEAIKEGDEIWLYGNRRETEGRTPEGTNFVDKQLSNTQVILLGEGFPTFAPAGGKDKVGWRRATVVRNGGSLTVSLGGEFKVACTRDVVILRRAPLEEAPDLKKKSLVEVRGSDGGEKHEKAKDDEKGVTVSQLVLLDAKAGGAYPILLPPDDE